MGKAARALALAGFVLVLPGCFSPSPTSVARLEDVKREGLALNEAADELEGRLLASQSNVSLWKELADRHKYVSAIAIQNQNAHFDAMVHLLDRQEEKARLLKHGHYAKRGTGRGLPTGVGGPDEDDQLGN